ncbi:hypothetical protein [Flavobacterium hungaricum]|uniref:Uncharacterized protein n=1 Tax=Flavobacterium hungaricum TaxID=2082725 RepID=A0ABR9TTH3_9FLAO|nr:hypothetical protein [Flavobacterium hungaricum]MBE8728322.1 hypothetical protein [Flavobacterium hungaricum]
MSEYLSNQKAIVPWLGTGIGIMIFGFAAVKVSLFLKQLPSQYWSETAALNNNYTHGIGVGLLIAGAMTILLSSLQHQKLAYLLTKSKYQYYTVILNFITTVIFALSISLIAYLIIAAKT